VEGVNQAFMVWEHHKHDDIMGFRDKAHASLITKSQSPVHHTPWKQAMDDSMAEYLKN